jgi:hypothetical protein
MAVLQLEEKGWCAAVPQITVRQEESEGLACRCTAHYHKKGNRTATDVPLYRQFYRQMRPGRKGLACHCTAGSHQKGFRKRGAGMPLYRHPRSVDAEGRGWHANVLLRPSDDVGRRGAACNCTVCTIIKWDGTCTLGRPGGAGARQDGSGSRSTHGRSAASTPPPLRRTDVATACTPPSPHPSRTPSTSWPEPRFQRPSAHSAAPVLAMLRYLLSFRKSFPKVLDFSPFFFSD